MSRCSNQIVGTPEEDIGQYVATLSEYNCLCDCGNGSNSVLTFQMKKNSPSTIVCVTHAFDMWIDVPIVHRIRNGYQQTHRWITTIRTMIPRKSRPEHPKRTGHIRIKFVMWLIARKVVATRCVVSGS